MTMRPVLLLMPLAILASAAAAQAPQGDPVRGREIAAQRCSSCHAIGLQGASAVPTAPPFRALQHLYAVEGLEEALAEGISVGDPMMPEHVMQPREIEDFIAYLKAFEPQVDPMAAAGRRLAERHCAECHALGEGESPLADAPPFRDLGRRFPLGRFTQAYSAGMFEGHPRMPLVRLDPDELDELAAYLRTHERPAPPPPGPRA